MIQSNQGAQDEKIKLMKSVRNCQRDMIKCNDLIQNYEDHDESELTDYLEQIKNGLFGLKCTGFYFSVFFGNRVRVC